MTHSVEHVTHVSIHPNTKSPQASRVLTVCGVEGSELAHRLGNDLRSVGLEVRPISLDFEPGTLEWKYAIDADMEKTICLVPILSPELDNDATLRYALQVAEERGIAIVPILARRDQYASAVRRILESALDPAKPRAVFLFRRTWNIILGALVLSASLALFGVLLVLALKGVLGSSANAFALQATGIGEGAEGFDPGYLPQPVPQYTEGVLLLEDDFQDGNMVGWSGDDNWHVVLDSLSNNYVLQGVGNGWTQISTGSSLWSDYAFEASVRVREIKNPPFGTGFGALFRQTYQVECEQLFYVWRPSLDYSVLAHGDVGEAEGCGNFVQLEVDPFQLPLDEWVRIRVELVGNTIRGYINGQPVFETSDPEPLWNGGIGFQVPPTNTVWFDDVRVVRLELAPE